MIKLLLVDDQRSVRRGLKMRFELEADICVVGEAENGEEAVTLARQLSPDVVIMDVEMPLMDGIAATQRIHQTMPAIGIVMLSIHSGPDTRARAQAAGAGAFIEKQGEFGPVLDAVYAVARH